jgi:3-methylfumaryl-CoA hydratase
MAVTLDREPGFTEGSPLPPAWHWLYFHDVVRASELGDEGHPRLGITMPTVPLPRRMWAGGLLEMRAPVSLGSWCERRSTITAITPRTGSTGPLFFVTVQHDLHADGQHRVREEQTIVYREMSVEATLPVPDPAPDDADSSREWRLDSTALFRYSALTFNGHRIHYDVDYARTVEGYPGLVVHGPLLATLLLDLAHSAGRTPATFRYRARSPVFLPHAFTVNLSEHDGDLRLWAATEDGGLAMSAEARGRAG